MSLSCNELKPLILKYYSYLFVWISLQRSFKASTSNVFLCNSIAFNWCYLTLLLEFLPTYGVIALKSATMPLLVMSLPWTLSSCRWSGMPITVYLSRSYAIQIAPESLIWLKDRSKYFIFESFKLSTKSCVPFAPIWFRDRFNSIRPPDGWFKFITKA